MIKVTWEWLGQGPALDLADTVTVVDGAEVDMIADTDDFARWAQLEAAAVPQASAEHLVAARPPLMRLRNVVRRVLADVAVGERPAPSDIEELNRASRSAPHWLALDPHELVTREEGSGGEVKRLLAFYARSAMDLIAEHRERLRRCPAPSCGMFYVSTRRDQRWCSTQCGTRARVARHYSKRTASSSRRGRLDA